MHQLEHTLSVSMIAPRADEQVSYQALMEKLYSEPCSCGVFLGHENCYREALALGKCEVPVCAPQVLSF